MSPLYYLHAVYQIHCLFMVLCKRLGCSSNNPYFEVPKALFRITKLLPEVSLCGLYIANHTPNVVLGSSKICMEHKQTQGHICLADMNWKPECITQSLPSYWEVENVILCIQETGKYVDNAPSQFILWYENALPHVKCSETQ